ncbi:hypothetical protein FQR65_LT02868 [Abscondita terminalis]|nr:hypothetical protein FQR65_LT02868 [Abscondita terminalis]
MVGVFNILLMFSVFAWVSSAPHHHFHKTVYVGGDGGGYSDGAVAGGGSLSFSGSFGGAGAAHKELKHEVVSEKVIDVEVPPAPEIKAQKTVIERTVIPQYVEKTVRVPTYVEKTIRVPSYVEKKVKVPVQPAVVEKTISQEHVPVGNVEAQGHVGKTVTIEKEYGLTGDRGARGHGGGEFVVSGGGGGYGGGYGEGHIGGHGGGFFDRIFNIPIQTLGAVNGLLNGLGGSGHVSGRISKSYSAF